MEDAHITYCSPEMDVFAVFDGHGGAEVARFCQLYLVSCLQQQASFLHPDEQGKVKVDQALIDTFHALDRMIDDPNRRYDFSQYRR